MTKSAHASCANLGAIGQDGALGSGRSWQNYIIDLYWIVGIFLNFFFTANVACRNRVSISRVLTEKASDNVIQYDEFSFSVLTAAAMMNANTEHFWYRDYCVEERQSRVAT